MARAKHSFRIYGAGYAWRTRLIFTQNSREDRHQSRRFEADSTAYSPYYRARYYDPTVGRFVSSDPIGFGGMTSNFYAYVANDPQDSWDPLGLRALTKCEKRNLAPYIPRIDLDNADIRENEWPPKIGKFFPIPLSKDWQP